MKTYKYIILFVSWLPAMISCSEWLDVNPQTAIKESLLFSHEEGFKSALTGVYIQMAEEELYGKNMSYYLPELLARSWYYVPSDLSQMSRFSDYKYKLTDQQITDDDEKLLNDIWLSYYRSIAQLNNILANLKNSKVNFKPGIADILKGEALGLRAFLHLDILRLFAEVPTPSALSVKAIPYMTDMTRNVNELISEEMGIVLKAIENDLDEAQRLLSKVDPIIGDTNNPSTDSWLSFRKSRFNYYAVLATKARFYLWSGDKTKAISFAKQVIDAQKFELADNNSYSSTGDLVFLKENIFNVVNPDHNLLAYSHFTNEGHLLTLSKTLFDIAYERGTNPDDIRAVKGRYWIDNINKERYISYLKYTGSNEAQIKAANTIPLIRLSEMYFVLMELYPLDEAAPVFREYRIRRMLNSVLENDLKEEVRRKARIESEFRKEFFAEGQMFYFYKRNKYEKFTWPSEFTIPAASLYTLPKPLKQSQYE